MDYNIQNQKQSAEYQMGMWQGTYSPDFMLVDEISKAIIGEAQAYNFYEVLAESASNDVDRKTIKSIQEDEAKHYHWFTMLLKGMRELPRIYVGEQPTDFKDGVRTAIHDELTANEFYLDISYRAIDPNIKMLFLYASQDEQRHATLLQNILMDL